MRDLPTEIRPVATGADDLSFARRALLKARSLTFILVHFGYLLLLEPIHWVVIWPLAKFRPSGRRRLIRAWLRAQALLIVALARVLAGVRIQVRGAIDPTSCIVVMNHQSILDIPIGISMIRGPYPLIPTRASYGFGIPGVSSMIWLMRCPLITQKPVTPRSELRALRDAADQVARREQSILIYPEGHRSRNGDILPFMKPGLRLILRRAPECPVYVVVVDGFTHLRSFSDTALRLAGSTGRVTVRGPYNTPADDVELDRFIDSLRERMVEGLAEMRRGRDPSPIPVSQQAFQ